MTDHHIERTYLFNARRATPQYPEANRYCGSLLPALVKLLHEEEKIHIITSQETILPELTPLQRVTLHCTHASPESREGRRIVKKLAKQLNPDIYHSATLYDSISSKIKSVATIHQHSPLNKSASQSTLRKRIKFLLRIRPRLKRFNTFISISSNLLPSYAGTKIEKHNVIIPYGVGKQFKELPQKDIDTVKNKYALPKRFLLMIMAGENTRNLTTVLDAMQSTDFTETSPLVIAGYSSKSDSITKLIEQRELRSRIYQAGPIEDKDMPALYNAAFTLLFPNIIKGTGLPVMEAMACGTPVICSSLPVLIELAAGAATLVHPTDKLEWCRAVSTALLSINWPEESRKAVLERAKSFSWEKAAEETLKVYRQLGAAKPHIIKNTQPVACSL